MHEYYSVCGWAGTLIIFFTFVCMQWYKKLPSGQDMQELASVVNSRGGNILVLAFFSIGFFIAALKFTYWIIGRASNGEITVENSVAMAAFTWMTGSAFGGAFTSMVKAMTGENGKARSSDMPENGGTLNVKGPITLPPLSLQTDAPPKAPEQKETAPNQSLTQGNTESITSAAESI